MFNGAAVESRAPILFAAPEELAAGWTCVKRDGTVTGFDCGKIRRAVTNCFLSTYYGGAEPTHDAVAPVVEEVTRGAVAAIAARSLARPTVEQVQQFVIQQLWIKGLFPAAEHYQNYRETQRKRRDLETATVFGKRVAFKPFEYPDAEKFKLAIQRTPWLGEQIDFTSDVQDFRVALRPGERSAVTRTVLAVSQVEVAVKKFWTKLGDRLQKPEFEQVGVVFGESEVRHADAYSRILDVLDLTAAFDGVTRVPAIRQRIEYLTKALRQGAAGDDRSFAKSIAVFALLVENVSLFSQFVVVKSFSRKTGLLQNIDNVVQATIKEEQVHAQFGVWLTNLIRAERPDWFGPAFYADLRAACAEAFAAEESILDWVFEEGDVPTVTRPALTEFLKDRINQGVTAVGGDPVFEVADATLAELDWFTHELQAPIDVDFFHKHATNYNTGDKPVTADSMW